MTPSCGQTVTKVTVCNLDGPHELPLYKNRINLLIKRFGLSRYNLHFMISFITSPAMISPATEGTNDILPGT